MVSVLPMYIQILQNLKKKKKKSKLLPIPGILDEILTLNCQNGMVNDPLSSSALGLAELGSVPIMDLG